MYRTAVGLSLVAFSLALGAAVMTEERPDSLRKQAEEAYKLQSYQTAVQKAKAGLAQKPAADEAAELTRILGLALSQPNHPLSNFQEGEKLLLETVQRPRFRTDPEIAETLAQLGMNGLRRPLETRQRVKQAAALFAEVGNRAKQYALWIKFAEYVRGQTWNLDLEGVNDWQLRQIAAVAYALDAYDRALKAAASAEEQVRVLHGQADLCRQHNQIQVKPRSQWPRLDDAAYPTGLENPSERALVYEREIVGRFPDTPFAAAARLRIGDTLQNWLSRFPDAVKAYEETIAKHAGAAEAKQAQANIDFIKAPNLGLNVQGVAQPGENPKYAWQARNLKEIKFAAYDVDLFAYTRVMHDRAQAEAFPLPAPAKEWTIETADEGVHKFLSSGDQPKPPGIRMPFTRRPTRPRPQPIVKDGLLAAPMNESGAYLVVATGTTPEGKSATVRVVMLVSKFTLVGKTGRTKISLFAADSQTGKPDNAEVLVRSWNNNEFNFEQRPIPDAGLLEIDAAEQIRNQHGFLAVAKRGKDYAFLDNFGQYWGWWWYQQTAYRVYAYTDRPVYRPTQTVQFKHLIRLYKDGAYANVANRNVKVTINDARGNKVFDKDLSSNENGTVSGELILPPNAALGMYYTQLLVDGQHVEMSPGARFRVEEYKKPEYEVTVSTDQPNVKIGQKLSVKIHGEYYFGGAVANAEVKYTVHRSSTAYYYRWAAPYDWFFDGGDDNDDNEGASFGGRRPYRYRRDMVKQGTLKTDAKGNCFVEFPAEGFPQTPSEDVEYTVEARMTDASRREIVGAKAIKVTHKAFALSLSPVRHVYQPEDTVRIRVKASDPNNRPIVTQAAAKIYVVTQREERDESGKIVKPERLREVDARTIKTDKDGDAHTDFVAKEEAYYKLTASAPEAFGGVVESSCYFWVGKQDGSLAHYANRDVELIFASDTAAPGDELQVLINGKHDDAYVLLTAEADDLYFSRVYHVKQRSASIKLPIQRNYQPNVTIRAAVLRGAKIHQVEEKLKVPPTDRFLTVTLKAPKKEFLPRETAEVEVEVVDHKGNPVSAEISLGACDASIFYIQQETRGDVRKFFHGRMRPENVQTRSSFEYQSAAATMAEAERSRLRDELSDTGRGGRALSNNYAGGAPGAPAPAMAAMEMADAAPGARRMLAKSESKGAGKDKAGAPDVEPEIRSEFPDSVYWAAHLKTDSAGKAKATVRFPDSLTTWRLTAVGATPDTVVGEAKTEVVTRKNIIVRLQAPRFAVERDTVVFSALVNNYLKEAKSVKVAFEPSPEIELSGDRMVTIEVPAGGEQRVDFTASIRRHGKATLLAKALTDVESDAMRIDFPVLEYGADKLLVDGGVLIPKTDSPEEVSFTLAIPKEVRAGSQSVTVSVSPTIAGVILESIPYLIEYPYGCTEQTMSRFVPAVLASHSLAKMGVDLGKLKSLAGRTPKMAERLGHWSKNPVYDKETLRKVIEAGVARLVDFQHADGGWGWWKNDQSNPYITAHVTTGLALAADAGVQIPAGVLERAARNLATNVVRPEPLNRYPWQAQENVAVRAYMLHALGQVDAKLLKTPAVRKKLDDVFQARSELGDYARALLALALDKAGLREQCDIVVANIKDRATVDEQTNTASWGTARNYYYWYDCGTEATSYSLKALVTLDPSSPLVPKAVNWLLRQRQGTRWYNTKDTATVCFALCDYLRATKELEPDLEATVSIAGRVVKTIRFTKDNLFTENGDVTLSGDALGAGPAAVSVKVQGRGKLYYMAAARFFTTEDPIPPAGNELFVQRSYKRLRPRVEERTRGVYNSELRRTVQEKYKEIVYDASDLKDGDPLVSGDLVEVTMDIDARNNFEYLLFEDPKPAGCEPTELTSGFAWDGGLGGHRELRDQKIAYFVTYLNQGKHRVSHRLRAEVPGVFHALPAYGESMYAPLVRGNSASRVIKIEDKK